MTRRRGSTTRGQSGQILVLTALLMTVLIGFAGLALDYGIGAMNQRQAQNAADAAALGAAYAIGTGATEAAAQAKAQQLAQAHGFSALEITVSFLDASGASTGNASQVATVRATLKHTTPTVLLRALNINTQTESATGSAAVGGATAGCVICVLDGTAPAAFNMSNSGSMTVTGGGISVNSNDDQAVTLKNFGTLTTSSFGIVGNYTANNGALNPAPTAGASAVADPLAKAPIPSCPTGNPLGKASVTLGGSGSVTAQPGTYTSLNITTSGSATMSPGTYCIAGTGLTISGPSSVTATGVLIYLTCGLYPTPSACQPNQAGAKLNFNNVQNITLSPPTSGPDQGIVIFADRQSTRQQSVTQSDTVALTGTVYVKAGQLRLDNLSNVSDMNSMIVCDRFTLTNSDPFNFPYTVVQNFAVGSPPALTQ